MNYLTIENKGNNKNLFEKLSRLLRINKHYNQLFKTQNLVLIQDNKMYCSNGYSINIINNINLDKGVYFIKKNTQKVISLEFKTHDLSTYPNIKPLLNSIKQHVDYTTCDFSDTQTISKFMVNLFKDKNILIDYSHLEQLKYDKSLCSYSVKISDTKKSKLFNLPIVIKDIDITVVIMPMLIN